MMGCTALAAELLIVSSMIILFIVPTPHATQYLEPLKDIHKIFMRPDTDQIRKGVTKTRAC